MTQPPLKLYSHPASPYCRKVRTALAYFERDYENRWIDVAAGDLQSGWFQEISPFGKMPALQAGETALYEATSIIEFLEETSARSFMPDSPREARHFDRVGDLYLLDPQGVLWFQPDSPGASQARATVERAWGVLEARLAGRPFLGGERFSFADLSAAVATDHLILLGLQPPEAVQVWVEACFQVSCMAENRSEAHPVLRRMLDARDASS